MVRLGSSSWQTSRLQGKRCFEPAVSKIKSLKSATDAAITILRIDDMIKLDKEQKKGGHGDECM